jgi:hypothetical protein
MKALRGTGIEVLVAVVVLGLPLAGFNTEGVALSDEAPLFEVGASSELAVEDEDAAPAPEEEPAVFDATAVTEPVWEDWM